MEDFVLLKQEEHLSKMLLFCCIFSQYKYDKLLTLTVILAKL